MERLEKTIEERSAELLEEAGNTPGQSDSNLVEKPL